MNDTYGIKSRMSPRQGSFMRNAADSQGFAKLRPYSSSAMQEPGELVRELKRAEGRRFALPL